MDLDSNKQMEGKTAEEQAKKAIGHVLVRIRDEAHIGWYFCDITQSFALLTEAYATLTGRGIEEVRDTFVCKAPENPAEDPNLTAAAAETAKEEWEPDVDDLLEVFRGLGTASRMVFIDRLKEEFCLECGGRSPVKPCFCQPHSRGRAGIASSNLLEGFC